MPKQPLKRIIASALAVLFGFGLTFLQIWKYNFLPTAKNFDWSVAKIGSQMLSTTNGGYSLPFEVVSILLLAAMIGCIVIAMKAPSQTSTLGKESDRSKETSKNNFEPVKKEDKQILPVSEDLGGASV